MSSRKRRRCFEDATGVLLPDEVDSGSKTVGGEPPSLPSASCAKSWERCGDGFLEAAAMENNLQTSARKLSDMRRFPTLVQTAAVNEDPVHIAWSSSDGEQSDDEAQQLPQRPARPTASVQSYSRALRMLRTEKEDLPAIDTDSDLDESEDDGEKDSGQQISDCESEQEESHLQPRHVTEPEISGYVSDGECVGVTPSRAGSPLRSGEGSKRSVRDWVRSAQALLQTPQKPLSKAPQDSANKKRRFQSGGLAERLNRLQSRQRSAVSFWRHQAVCDTTTTTTTTVDRPGVLVLEVLEVQEECSMQLVHCERRPPPGEGRRRRDPLPGGGAGLLVLFSRETAAQLIPAPSDVIHVYPPWQILSIDGLRCNAILNTHFSQKVFSAAKPAGASDPRGPRPAGRCGPPSLCRTFGLLEPCGTTEGTEAKRHLTRSFSDPVVYVAARGGGSSGARRSLSLLEAMEGLGQAGCVGQDVEVVVQRVYSVPVPDCSPGPTLKARLPSTPAETGRTRLCVLVQDGYGTFSVVQLHFLPRSDDLHHYCREWQGRTCLLRGIKVVQRVTRERSTRLFSLIDSLWPPVMPLKDHGDAPSACAGRRSAGVAPRFCYLLSGQESSVEPCEDRTVSPLYLPPTRQTLREVLQSERQTRRCSFVATVLHKRKTQGRDVGQREVWLLLTDAGLQEERPERPCGRTVALCVSTSCALTSSVLESLNSPAPFRVSFRDAIREHGVLLCAEQSVVEVCSVDPEPRPDVLPQPVRLDALTPEVTPNSVCSVSGVIVGVDEATAYSWPACNRCGSDNLEKLPERPPNLRCVACESPVDEPDTRIRLEVFLSSSLSNCTLKVKLRQETIASILNPAALEAHEFPGYDVENVLGKEVGPLAVYVRVVTRKPALWIGLEEICL
ncbi:LOW QUALITY PROTEIN: DNA repair-scaffolding protein [Spinachia spinachia]